MRHQVAHPPASAMAFLPQEAHGTAGERCVALVKCHLYRVVKRLVLPVAHGKKRAVLPPAIVVRCLHKTNFFILKVVDKVVYKIWVRVIVAVYNPHYFRLGVGVLQGKVKRSRLGAGKFVHMKEPELRPQCAAMFLYRAPEPLIFCVVVYNQHFVVFIVELGDFVECRDYQLRRLRIRRHMQRHHRPEGRGALTQGCARPAPVFPAQDIELLYHLQEPEREGKEQQRVDYQEQRAGSGTYGE